MKKLIGEALATIGYIHVTGLETAQAEGQQSGVICVTNLRQLGCRDYNNGVAVAVTVNGEVWIASGSGIGSLDEGEKAKQEKILAEVCPNGTGAFVPCSNGETIAIGQMMARVANPGWIGDNHHPVAPFDIYLTK